MRRLFCITLLLSLGGSWAQAATAEYYTAGVVEFRPSVAAASSAELLQEHLTAYLQLIHSSEANETDIIVFPEATLNSVLQLTTVPAPHSTQAQLCPDGVAAASGFLSQLACAARATGKYLLVNVKERAACVASEACAARGYHVYNTNVVFDRQGCIVSRYRKWNLYLEPQTNRTASPEYGSFQTDFGVTFAHFICFDMLFYTPAQELVQRLGMRDVIISKMFTSELPFLTATQLQLGWAWGNNVNLLAAGASLPQSGISGSGIYAGQQGALVQRLVGNSSVGVRELLVARVPRLSSYQPQLDMAAGSKLPQRQLRSLQQPQLEHFVTQLLPQRNGSSSHQLCQQDLCCHFELTQRLELQALPARYQYRLGVFVGQRSYEQQEYTYQRLCGIFACLNQSLQSCGRLVDETVLHNTSALRFEALSITGQFVHRNKRLLMPNTLSASLYALQPAELSWQLQELQAEQLTQVQLVLRQPQTELLTFGIYGNYFDERSAAGAASTLWWGLCSLALVLALNLGLA